MSYQHLTGPQLDEIDARAAHLYEYEPLPDEADIVVGTDVPALLVEIRELTAERDRARRIAVRLEQETARLEERVTELEAERAKYVGVEPTIAEEMAYLSRCLHAVYDLCAEVKRTGSLGVTPEAVEQAADGEWTAATARPALPWAHTMPDDDLHGFLHDLVSAAIDRWRSDPNVPDREILANIEKVCANWRTPGQGHRSDDDETGEPR